MVARIIVLSLKKVLSSPLDRNGALLVDNCLEAELVQGGQN